MSSHVLVVDDDRQITDFLARFLSRQGYRVATAGSAKQMGLLMEHTRFDLLILDVGLPDVDGFQITRELRRSSTLPIIMLTVRDEVYDRIVGLEIGADDYMAKPFEPHELLARVRAVLRRVNAAEHEPVLVGKARRFAFAGLQLTLDTQKITTDGGGEIALTSSEYTLLAALAQRAGRVVARDELMDILYSGAIHVAERAIDAHVARIRRKLSAAGVDGDLIRAVHGQGYCLATEVRRDPG